MKIAVVCAYCGQSFEKNVSDVNKQRRNVGPDVPFFCSQAHAGARRRLDKSQEQRAAEKAAYDVAYRAKDPAKRKAQNAEWFRRTYDPGGAREYRRQHRAKIRASQSVTINRPAYKSYKREYGRALRANEYGPFAEAYLILLELQRAIRIAVPSKYERQKARGYFDNFRSPQQRKMNVTRIR